MSGKWTFSTFSRRCYFHPMYSSPIISFAIRNLLQVVVDVTFDLSDSENTVRVFCLFPFQRLSAYIYSHPPFLLRFRYSSVYDV